MPCVFIFLFYALMHYSRISKNVNGYVKLPHFTSPLFTFCNVNSFSKSASTHLSPARDGTPPKTFRTPAGVSTSCELVVLFLLSELDKNFKFRKPEMCFGISVQLMHACNKMLEWIDLISLNFNLILDLISILCKWFTTCILESQLIFDRRPIQFYLSISPIIRVFTISKLPSKYSCFLPWSRAILFIFFIQDHIWNQQFIYDIRNFCIPLCDSIH